MVECGVSPSMLSGQELGYCGASRPMGSTSGTNDRLELFGSTGQGRWPVESLKLPQGCFVEMTGRPLAPTDRLCPVPMIPVQSHGRLMGASEPVDVAGTVQAISTMHTQSSRLNREEGILFSRIRPVSPRP